MRCRIVAHRAIGALALVGWLLGLPPGALAGGAGARGHEPAVEVLTPRDGLALNAAALRVRALVGGRAGRLQRVELALDGAVLHAIAPACRRAALVDFHVDLTTVSAGPHALTLVVVHETLGRRQRTSVKTTFILDPTLPRAPVNRVEEAATPEPFACFTVRGAPGAAPFDSDDDDREDERPWGRPARLELHGTLVPGAQSDGIDLSRDRVVVAVGANAAVLEPGDRRCRRFEPCRYRIAGHPWLHDVRLDRRWDGRWQFAIRGGPLPRGARAAYLRIGNDWGGVDLTTGERIADLPLHLDTMRRAQAAIGPLGATLEATDAAGVVVRLEVPPGALTREHVIAVTPLTRSPQAHATALHSGVKLEPEGLVLARPATLTLDFSRSGQPVDARHATLLLTSPITAVPLAGDVDPARGTLRARLHHFSTVQGGQPGAASTDPAAWANDVLAASDPLSLDEIETLLELAAVQQQMGCASSCIDLARLEQRVRVELEALLGTVNLVEIREIRSEQLPGVRANFLPGGSGSDRDPYIMVGARADDRIHVAVTIATPPEIAHLPLAAGLSEAGETSVPAIAFAGNSAVTVARPVIWPRPVDYHVVVGLDANRDGWLADTETLASSLHTLGRVKGVSRAAYVTSRSILTALNLAGSPVALHAGALLAAFLLGTPPLAPDVRHDTETIAFDQPGLSLQHNTGVVWNADGTAQIPRFTFGRDTAFSTTLLRSHAFTKDVVVRMLRNRAGDIAGAEPASPNEEVVQIDIGVQSQGVNFGPELAPPASGLSPFLGIAGAAFTGTLRARVRRSTAQLLVEAVEVDGRVEDLYDFELDRNADGAIVQAGFPTLGNGGRIFRTVVEIAGVRADLGLDLCAPVSDPSDPYYDSADVAYVPPARCEVEAGAVAASWDDGAVHHSLQFSAQGYMAADGSLVIQAEGSYTFSGGGSGVPDPQFECVEAWFTRGSAAVTHLVLYPLAFPPDEFLIAVHGSGTRTTGATRLNWEDYTCGDFVTTESAWEGSLLNLGLRARPIIVGGRVVALDLNTGADENLGLPGVRGTIPIDPAPPGGP